MRRLATDPELTRVLGGLEASRELGQVLFGQSVLRPRLVRVVGGMASLTDCQDTSMHGRMVAATGRKVTIGHSNDLAYTTMRRGADGVWRVAAIEYAPAGSCSA